MRTHIIALIGLVLACSLVVSCTALRSGSAVKAGFSAQQGPDEAIPPDRLSDDGWADRWIPGWKKAGKIIPEPSESRRKWDERMKRNRARWDEPNPMGWY